MSAHHSTKAGNGSSGAPRPSGRALGWLVAGVLVVHMVLILGMSGTLDWRLQSAEPIRVAPMQTRWVAPPVATPAPAPNPAAKPRTRVATEPAKKPPTTAPVAEPAAPADAATVSDSVTAAPPEPTLRPSAEAASQPAAESAPQVNTATEVASVPAATMPADVVSVALPPILLGALPPPVLLNYRLTGQDKGLTYHASGELKWQHNEAAYALSLSVKAFLVGSRHWRSQGDITHAGLAPARFSDSWRNERAAHFDRANQRVVFSNNAPVATLEAGAQDQISLYVQLAAAMAGEPQRFQPGARLQVQTATIRDALPWLLTMGPPEALQLNGQSISTFKWVCQPRNRFDATVEFWVSAQHAWMPVRIRITQVSGSFIDLMLRSQEALPPLPAVAAAG